MEKKRKLVLSIVLAGMLNMYLYVTFHELGHLIVMLSAGEQITEFSIFTAHVSGIGGNYTNVSDLWLHANGALLPLLLSYVYLLFYRKNWDNTFYRIFSWFVGLVPAASLLAWVFIPFLYMAGSAPAGDDVTKFLFNFSQSYHPLIVSLAAAILMVISVILIVKKRVLQNFIAEIRNARKSC